MTYSFHPEAEEELDRAVDYYEAYSPGLGMEFADEIYATIQRIIRFPEAWSQVIVVQGDAWPDDFPSVLSIMWTEMRLS